MLLSSPCLVTNAFQSHHTLLVEIMPAAKHHKRPQHTLLIFVSHIYLERSTWSRCRRVFSRIVYEVLMAVAAIVFNVCVAWYSFLEKFLLSLPLSTLARRYCGGQQTSKNLNFLKHLIQILGYFTQGDVFRISFNKFFRFSINVRVQQ